MKWIAEIEKLKKANLDMFSIEELPGGFVRFTTGIEMQVSAEVLKDASPELFGALLLERMKIDLETDGLEEIKAYLATLK